MAFLSKYHTPNTNSVHILDIQLLLGVTLISMYLSARHVVEKESDIKRAMEFLHECDLLNIEDVLPFFPDFVTIDHFKVRTNTSLYDSVTADWMLCDFFD